MPIYDEKDDDDNDDDICKRIHNHTKTTATKRTNQEIIMIMI